MGKDHYVPVVYLKNFADPQFKERGKLHVFDFRSHEYQEMRRSGSALTRRKRPQLSSESKTA
jgi:hypothetical protein